MNTAIEEILTHKQNHKFNTLCEDSKIALKNVVEADNKLKELLKDMPDAINALLEFQNAREEVQSDDNINTYKIGFRFGFRLAMDVFEIK